jgi:hypothetical protein
MTNVGLSKPRLSPNDRRAALLSACFVLLTAALLASPAAGPLRYGFPALAFLFAFFIFRLSRPFYAGFVVWLWMLAPLVRRIVEYRAGGAASLIIASPFLACAVPALLNLGSLSELLSSEGYPLLFASAGIAYGLGIGILLHNPISLIFGQLAQWIAPLLFAFFVVRFRPQVLDIRTSIEKAFLWGTLFTGAYGLYQYLVLAPWDALWIQTANITSIGFAEPRQMRVFSTMNSPQGLASFLIAGIFIAVHSRSQIKWLTIPLASLSLLLTQSRSGWLGFVFGLAYLVFYLPVRQKLQLTVFGVLSMILVLVALQGPQKDALTARIQSLTAPSEDGSVAARTTGYVTLLPEMITAPFGAGVGLDESSANSPTSKGGEGLGIEDSAIIAVLFSLGIPGTIMLLTGIGSGAFAGFRNKPGEPAGDLVAFRAILIAMAVGAVSTNTVQGLGGFLIWMSLTVCYLSRPRERPLRMTSETNQEFALPVPGGKPAPLAPRTS